MAAEPNRLRTSAEFGRVFGEGRATHGKLLSVRVADAAGSDTGQAKVGFTVGKTVSLKAVVRNRVRRRLREIIRGLERDGKLDAVELVISAKRPAASADSARLSEELEQLLKQAGALR